MARRNRYNRKRRRGGFSLLYKLLTFLVICAAIAVALTLFFKVERIDVIGAERYTQQKIIDASGIQIEDNMFFMNKYEVSDQITSALPYIETVQIRRALPDGTLALDWYRDGGRTLAPATEQFVYQGGFACQNYTVAPVDRVRIALTETDGGTCTPEPGENTLSIVGNYLLTQDPTAVAEHLLDLVGGMTYTPCTVVTNAPIAPGEIFRVVHGGVTYRALAMTVERSGGKFTVTCTGSANRTLAAASGSQYRALAGRVLNLQWGLDGVKSQLAEFSDQETKLSELSQTMDHITARVSVLQTGADIIDSRGNGGKIGYKIFPFKRN